MPTEKWEQCAQGRHGIPTSTDRHCCAYAVSIDSRGGMYRATVETTFAELQAADTSPATTERVRARSRVWNEALELALVEARSAGMGGPNLTLASNACREAMHEHQEGT